MRTEPLNSFRVSSTEWSPECSALLLCNAWCSINSLLPFPRNGVRGYQSELFFYIIFARRPVVSPERSLGLAIRIILLHYLCPPFCPFPGTESGATNQNYSFALSLPTALSFPRNGVRGYQSELFFCIIFARRPVVSPERSPGLPIRIIFLHYLCPPFCPFPGTESEATNPNYSFALSLLTTEDGATVQVRR